MAMNVRQLEIAAGVIIAFVSASAAVEVYGHGPAPVVEYPERPGPEPRLCQTVKPWFNKTFNGMPVPFNGVFERNDRIFWAWRTRHYSCAIEMVDI